MPSCLPCRHRSKVLSTPAYARSALRREHTLGAMIGNSRGRILGMLQQARARAPLKPHTRYVDQTLQVRKLYGRNLFAGCTRYLVGARGKWLSITRLVVVVSYLGQRKRRGSLWTCRAARDVDG